jgi:hypothetical protein
MAGLVPAISLIELRQGHAKRNRRTEPGDDEGRDGTVPGKPPP